MTSTSVKLSVRSIADLICAVPYLLGFHPTESVVLVAFRDRSVVFAARADLPPSDMSTESRRAGAAHLASMVANQDAETGTVIGYGPVDRVRRAVEEVAAALDRAGLAVVDVLRVEEGRYWSYTCENPECCPPDGTPYDPSASPIPAAATFAGQVALPDRAALVQRVAAVGGPRRESMRRATKRAERRLATLLAGAPATDPLDNAGSTDLGRQVLKETGELAVRDAMTRQRDGGRLSDDEVAWLSLLLVHTPIRDYAWERLGTDDWHIALWTDVLRRAEADLAAAPASLLAFAAWRAGHGALASVAVERALASVPDYPMALLIDEVLRNGIAPSKLDALPAGQ